MSLKQIHDRDVSSPTSCVIEIISPSLTSEKIHFSRVRDSVLRTITPYYRCIRETTIDHDVHALADSSWQMGHAAAGRAQQEFTFRQSLN